MTTTQTFKTRGQRLAQVAFECIQKRKALKDKPRKEYVGFAKRFPSLIHSCGLAQALAFAQAKAPEGYLDDLAAVLKAEQREMLLKKARESAVPEYMRLSREALEAAGWLKRYAEALLDEDATKGGV